MLTADPIPTAKLHVSDNETQHLNVLNENK